MQKSKQRKRRKGQSKYAAKLKAGNMMYGPGCCAHRIKLNIERIPNARRLRGEEEARLIETSGDADPITTDRRFAVLGAGFTLADQEELEARVLARLEERRQLGDNSGTVQAVQTTGRQAEHWAQPVLRNGGDAHRTHQPIEVLPGRGHELHSREA